MLVGFGLEQQCCCIAMNVAALSPVAQTSTNEYKDLPFKQNSCTLLQNEQCTSLHKPHNLRGCPTCAIAGAGSTQCTLAAV